MEFASSKFEQINKKAPTEDDKERLKEFLTTGMLFESVMEAELGNDKVDDVPFDDEDEEYCPDKDENDYEQDAVDEEEFEKDFAKMGVDVADSNENENTSNMIDIN